MSLNAQELSVPQPYEANMKKGSRSRNISPLNTGIASTNYSHNNHLEQCNIYWSNIIAKNTVLGFENGSNQKVLVPSYNNCTFKHHQLTLLKELWIIVPDYNRKINYYKEFWRVYLQNEVLVSQIKENVGYSKDAEAKIARLEVHDSVLKLK